MTVSNETPKDNLELWNKYRTPNPKYVKEVAYGKRKFSCIDPQYQLQLATNEWGPYGTTWGLADTKFQVHDSSIFLEAMFYYPTPPNIECNGKFPIAVDMPYKPGDDCCKKLMTNARSKALSMLGFSADVYMGMFDDVHYIEQAKIKHGDKHQFVHMAIDKIKRATSVREIELKVDKIWEMYHDDILDAESCEAILVASIAELNTYLQTADEITAKQAVALTEVITIRMKQEL